jgi:hypothetical protein
MLIVETIARIRREHFIKGKTIKEIARNDPSALRTVPALCSEIVIEGDAPGADRKCSSNAPCQSSSPQFKRTPPLNVQFLLGPSPAMCHR